MTDPSREHPAWFAMGMCYCGDMQPVAMARETGGFVPHTDRRTGQPCPSPEHRLRYAARVLEHEETMRAPAAAPKT